MADYNIRLSMGLSCDSVAKYLHEVSNDFIPPLCEQVDIDEYSEKLVANGVSISAISHIEGNKIVGMLAGYYNAPQKGFSFVSIFHVRQAYRRLKIGKQMMDVCVSVSRQLRFKEVRLMVDKRNASAIAFYEHYGFRKLGETETQFSMGYAIVE